MTDDLNRDQVYEKKIKPLVEKIINICDIHNIPAVMAFGGEPTPKEYPIETSYYVTDATPIPIKLAQNVLTQPQMAVFLEMLIRKASAMKASKPQIHRL